MYNLSITMFDGRKIEFYCVSIYQAIEFINNIHDLRGYELIPVLTG